MNFTKSDSWTFELEPLLRDAIRERVAEWLLRLPAAYVRLERESQSLVPGGSGYPRGPLDSTIPVKARMSSARCWRNTVQTALPLSAGIAMMTPMAGTKLDADGFRALKALVARGTCA